MGASPEWDYTFQADYYHFRPNYAPAAIDRMLEVAALPGNEAVAADVGAGTGNLSLMLAERGLKVIAIEPNEAMRRRGLEATRDRAIRWLEGTGEKTGLAAASVDLFAMGSSFNTTDRQATLKEAHRTLKACRWFTCLWNHRDLNEEHQLAAEEILRGMFPEYAHGSRREDQGPCLLSSGLFTDLTFFEEAKTVEQNLEEYIGAWKSVKNRYWDLSTAAGRGIFEEFAGRLRKAIGPNISAKYTTRVWMVRRV